MPNHKNKTSATKRMLELWRTQGPDFGRTRAASWWAENGKQFGTPGPNSMTEMVCRGKLELDPAIVFEGSPVSHGDLMQMTEGVHNVLQGKGAIDEQKRAAEITRNIIAERDETIHRAAGCLWRIRDAAHTHLQKPSHTSRDDLKAAIEEAPFESLAAIKRDAVREIIKAAQENTEYAPNVSPCRLKWCWLTANVETFFNE